MCLCPPGCISLAESWIGSVFPHENDVDVGTAVYSPHTNADFPQSACPQRYTFPRGVLGQSGMRFSQRYASYHGVLSSHPRSLTRQHY